MKISQRLTVLLSGHEIMTDGPINDHLGGYDLCG